MTEQKPKGTLVIASPPKANNIFYDEMLADKEFLEHHGVKGQKWGVITKEYKPVGRRKRRFMTAIQRAKERRRLSNPKNLTDEELDQQITRYQKEEQLRKAQGKMTAAEARQRTNKIADDLTKMLMNTIGFGGKVMDAVGHVSDALGKGFDVIGKGVDVAGKGVSIVKSWFGDIPEATVKGKYNVKLKTIEAAMGGSNKNDKKKDDKNKDDNKKDNSGSSSKVHYRSKRYKQKKG